MNSPTKRIMEYAEAQPEATPIQTGDLLQLGDRSAVSRTLSRLSRSERLLRICRGLYRVVPSYEARRAWAHLEPCCRPDLLRDTATMVVRYADDEQPLAELGRYMEALAGDQFSREHRRVSAERLISATAPAGDA